MTMATVMIDRFFLPAVVEIPPYTSSSSFLATATTTHGVVTMSLPVRRG